VSLSIANNRGHRAGVHEVLIEFVRIKFWEATGLPRPVRQPRL